MREVDAWYERRVARRDRWKADFVAPRPDLFPIWRGFWQLQPDRPVIATMAGAVRDGIPYLASSQWLRDHGLAVDSKEGEFVTSCWEAMQEEMGKHEAAKAQAATSAIDKESK